MTTIPFMSLLETDLIHAVADINDELHQSQQEQYMSITGASYLTTSIHDLIAAAKSAIDDARSQVGGAVDELHGAAGDAIQLAAAIRAEASDLRSGLGQFTNGAPANVPPMGVVTPNKTPLPPAPTLVDSIIPTAPPLPTPAVAPAIIPAAEPKKNEGSV